MSHHIISYNVLSKRVVYIEYFVDYLLSQLSLIINTNIYRFTGRDMISKEKYRYFHLVTNGMKITKRNDRYE
jgi:hypothetical protein